MADSVKLTLTTTYVDLGVGPLSIVPQTIDPFYMAVKATIPANDAGSAYFGGEVVDYNGTGHVWVRSANVSGPIIVVYS